METLIIVLLSIGLIIAIFALLRKKEAREDDGAMKLLLEQMNELSRVVDRKIGDTNKTLADSMQSQFSESQKLIDKFLRELGTMTEKVTRVEETGKQMVSFADQLQSLQDILKNPKQRGILGEYYLENLLSSVMAPEQYTLQYDLGADDDGNKLIPDAIVKLKDKIVPIDSKFSLENYNRFVSSSDPAEKERFEKLFVNDLKNRIKETSKYIQIKKGTTNFAIMFIPHEAIYYDLLINKINDDKEDAENLIQRAANKYSVIIVSPTSLFAYLQTISQGLRMFQIEEHAEHLKILVGNLQKHLKGYEEYHSKLGNALGTAVNQFNYSSKEFGKIDKDVLKITGEGMGLDLRTLDKPEID